MMPVIKTGFIEAAHVQRCLLDAELLGGVERCSKRWRFVTFLSSHFGDIQPAPKCSCRPTWSEALRGIICRCVTNGNAWKEPFCLHMFGGQRSRDQGQGTFEESLISLFLSQLIILLQRLISCAPVEPGQHFSRSLSSQFSRSVFVQKSRAG